MKRVRSIPSQASVRLLAARALRAGVAGSSYDDLLAFPKAPRSEAGFQLGKIQAGLEPTDWKPFDAIGPGTREIRIADAKGIFRVMYVAKPGANLFLELGFSAAEARKLHAASRKQINDTRLLKQQLMSELSNWIAEHQLRQADAAQILMVSRPRVSDVVNQKTSKFTIDTLVEMLSRVGKPVRLAIG